MTPLSLSIDDLLEYTDWQRAAWFAFFRENPSRLSLSGGPHGDGRFATIGDLAKHVLSAELRYVQRLNNVALSDFTAFDSTDLTFLETLSADSRRSLRQLLEDFPEQQWESPREFIILNRRVVTTPKKIVFHVLMHEVRHWAQIGTLCRVSGHAPQFQDFLASPVWGGGLAQI
jgi:uncharacterized damage-inducible protein DinB